MNVAALLHRHRVVALLSLLLLAPMLAASSHAPAIRDVDTAVHAGYRVQDLDWFDPVRGRAVPVKLFWPDAARTRTVPLVVFSHGIGSARDGYTYLGRYWARHGIASLHVQHVGSDRTLWEGNPFTLVSRFQHAAGDAEAIDRDVPLQGAKAVPDHRRQRADHRFAQRAFKRRDGGDDLRGDHWHGGRVGRDSRPGHHVRGEPLGVGRRIARRDDHLRIGRFVPGQGVRVSIEH